MCAGEEQELDAQENLIEIQNNKELKIISEEGVE